MCSGSDAGSYSRLIDCVFHSTLGLRVIKKKKLPDAGRGADEEALHPDPERCLPPGYFLRELLIVCVY